jgi:hypothetical protein
MALLKQWWDKITGKEEDIKVEIPQENSTKRMDTLEEAKKHEDAYAVMTFKMDIPILTTPVNIIKCSEEDLKTLHRDLCEVSDEEYEKMKSENQQNNFGEFYYIKREYADSETVFNNLSNLQIPLSKVMSQNGIWINQHFKENLLNKRKIKEVIEGERKRLRK